MLRKNTLKKINLNVPVNSLGYGVVGYNIWKEFNKIQDVTLWPIPDANHISPPHQIDQDTVYQIRIDVGKAKNGPLPIEYSS